MLDIANALRTSLDAVLFAEFDQALQPDELDVTNTVFFNPITATGDAYIFEEGGAVGEFEKHSVGQERIIESLETGNRTVIDIENWKKTLAIEKEKFDDAKHGVIAHWLRDTGRKMRLTRIHQAVLNTYADGFDGNEFNTPDGVSLYNNSHTNLNGDTVDNLETGTLTPDNLDTLVQVLRKQVDQKGDLGSHGFAGLLVPTALYATAVEVMESELIPQSAENDVNFFKTKYGTTAISTTPFLDTDFNSATNAATSYYAVGRGHSIMRAVRDDANTTLVGWEFDPQDRYMYKASYRETAFPGTWEGTAASNGTV